MASAQNRRRGKSVREKEKVQNERDDDDDDDEDDDDNDDDDDERVFIPLVLSVKALYNEKKNERINTQTEARQTFLNSLLAYFSHRVQSEHSHTHARTHAFKEG